MNTADRQLLQIPLPPLLRLGVAAALTHPPGRHHAGGTKPPRTVAPRHVHAP